MTAPGWYNAEGDPPGTTRYWDGEAWVGDPVATPAGPVGQATQSGGQGNLASAGSRIGARLIDLIILIVISLIVVGSIFVDIVNDLSDLPSNASDAQVQAVVEDAFENGSSRILLAGLAAFLWDWLFVAFAGGTPGKLMLGLRVASASSRKTPPSLMQAGARALNRAAGLLSVVSVALGNIAGLVVGLVGLASLIMLFAHSERRTVMDLVGGPIVIKK